MQEQDIQRAKELRAKGWKWREVGEELRYDPDHLRRCVRNSPQNEAPKISICDRTTRLTDIVRRSGLRPEDWLLERASIQENGLTRVWVKRIPDLESFHDQLLADIRAVSLELREDAIEYPSMDDPHMLELSPFDLHQGKLGWGEEVMRDYDSSIAVERYKAACMDLIHRAAGFDFDEVLFPVGNDLMHVDTKISTTTMGTYQDTDTRYQKIFRTSHRISNWTIRMLKVIAPVKVIVIPGNHDHIGMFMLGEVLAAAFENDPNVTIDNTAPVRKYHRYGVNLLGFTHGNEELHSELPLIMADERAQDWADTLHREWHIGHRHNKKQMSRVTHDQFRTTGVRILPSLCGQDYWHFKKGYRHLPQAEAHVWSKKNGHVATFTHTSPEAW